MKKKTMVLFFTILCFILLLVGGSYAYWSWNSDKDKNLVFNTAKGLEEYIIYDEGDSYFIGNFQPVDSFCLSAHNTISFYKTEEAANVSLLASVKMNVNSIGENSSLSNDVYWIITSGDSNIDCNDGLNSSNVLNYGSFNGMSSGDVITLLSDEEVTLTEKKFTVWIWIDNASANLSSLSGETIDTNIWTQIDMIESESSVADGAASPVLDEGMIPVTISADGTVTTISKYDNSWYNYEKKEWANAILVNESSRSSYVNTSGVTVNNSDILAYYVWVPRYKYQVWTTTTSSQGNEQEIDIVFEPRDATYSVATAVGQYQTHPAFWWDDNSNGVVDTGELISGFWVGKFEATGTEDTPTILPNVTSLRNQNISTQFQTSLKFSGGTLNNGNVTFSGSDIYGLTSNTDSHMMKNSEWGAVAYLSHSKYGINGEIRINNNSDYTTGCGASTADASSSSSCEITYGGATEYPQSTTGNITGIYDMSGGAFEYVMGVLSDSNGSPRSGNSTNDNSGFNGIIYDDGNNTEYVSGINFPESKYYDLYLSSQFTGDYSSNNNLCTLETCGGHALYETANWYENYGEFVGVDYPWFTRGGYRSQGSGAGIFYSSGGDGHAYSRPSWRSVLIFDSIKTINYDVNGGSGAPPS